MHTELELLSTLKELRCLYQSGELRELDFNCKIQEVERQITEFENTLSEVEHD